MNNQQNFQKVAFLDTNILHYIGIYLEYAQKEGLSLSVDKEKAIQNINGRADADLKKSLKQGLETVYFLSGHKVQVQYSPISELELLSGRARGRAILSAAKEKVPDRMWSRFREEQISDRVSVDDLKDVKDGVDRLTSLLKESGVAVKMSGGDEMRDVLELAKGINGLIYMEAKDSIIYASTLLAKADCLFSADEYLRDTINKIRGMGSSGDTDRYKGIRKQLRQLSDIRPGTAVEVELPSAHTITAQGNVKPALVLKCNRSS